MRLSKAAQEKTVFVTSHESGEFIVFPFGPKNRPTEFSKAMHIVLGKLRGKIAFNFLNDTFVPGSSIEELLYHVELVLKAFAEYNLACPPEKCYFAATKIEFLGFEISRGQMRPGVAKITAIVEFPVPTDVHEVPRFVGLVSFFRRFLKNFALRIAPVTNLKRKNVEFKWTKSQQNAFDDIRLALTQGPVLRLFNPKSITELHTDASKNGIARLFLQKSSEDSPLSLVYAVSKKTTERESRYHSSKLEYLPSCGQYHDYANSYWELNLP